MRYPHTNATVETLPNGLHVLLDPDPSHPVVSAQWWVETGSIHEDRHLGSGISHFLEHMVFKGTKDFSGAELAESVQAAGGHWNAYTSFDRTVYYIDGPSESLPLFLQCLSGMVLFPTLPEDEFAGEQDVIRREIDMGLDDADQAAMQLMFRGAFLVDPRRHPVIGHRHRFDTLTPGDLTGYHRARYTTDRSFVALSGDFDPVRVMEILDTRTAGALAGAGREVWVPRDDPQAGPRLVRETFALPHTRLSAVWKMPALEDVRTPAFEVLAAILGQGRSSRLHRRLREERGLALEISSFAWNTPGREGLFGVSADCETAKTGDLVGAIEAQIRGLCDGDLGDEAEKAKRRILAAQFRSLVTASGRAGDLASNWHEARDLDFTRSHVDAVMSVTTDDLRAAAEMLTDRTRTLGILDPLESTGPARSTQRRRASGGVQTHRLANGVTVALLHDARVPLVHLQAAVMAGLPSESPSTNGINQLLSSSLPKGTATRDGETIAQTLESLGASTSASAGNNALLVQAAGLAPDFHTIADVWCEMLTAPSFPPDAVDREKQSQLAALREARTEPLHVGFRELRRAIFAGSGLGLDLSGSEDSLAALERGDLVVHHARHFPSANMAVAVAGDFDGSAVIDALEAGLQALPAGPRWSGPPGTLRPGGEHIVRLPKKQAVLCVGFPCGGATDESRHALAMLNEYAADMAGPLFTRIREQLGLAYQVGATRLHGWDMGVFTFYLATSPEQLDLAREELMKQVAAIASAGIPEGVFDRVRATVLSGLALGGQSPSHLARHAVLDQLFGLPADHHRCLPDIMRGLTPKAVRAVAEQVCSAVPTVAVVLPEVAGS